MLFNSNGISTYYQINFYFFIRRRGGHLILIEPINTGTVPTHNFKCRFVIVIKKKNDLYRSDPLSNR